MSPDDVMISEGIGDFLGLVIGAVCTLLWGCCFSACHGNLLKEPTVEQSQEEERQETRGIACNGALFELVADRVWKIPSIGDEEGTSIHIVLRITNRTAKVLRINKFDTVGIALSTSEGESLPIRGGRNAVRGGIQAISPPLLPGQQFSISRQARLVWLNNVTLRLIGSEDFGGIWYFDGLSPGKYRLQLFYENLQAQIGEIGSIWTGKVSTPALEVEVR